MRSWFCALALMSAVGCSLSSADDGAFGVPTKPDIPTPPTEAPPTGQKWEGIEIDGACGKLGLAWVLVDETCGGTNDPAYLDYFRAPMFRDGARVGDFLYVVDATHLWVVEAADPSGMSRERLTAGLGEPLAMARHGEAAVLIAAGSAGLIVLDATDPLDPTFVAQVALDGPALDVHVAGDVAYVATGAAGVGVVDLTSHELLQALAVPGFAAGVFERDGLAYVAACSTVAIVDVATGDLLSQIWLDEAYDHQILVAPAKDMTLVGDVAFVAAGRFGAVAIDVAVPTQPKILGNCTVANDPAFYASGVRTGGDTLYVAGGEYGIKPVDVENAASACPSFVMPKLPAYPDSEGECSSDPPWKVVSWTESFPPPPPPSTPPPEPNKDPIQTLPFGDIVYAFGDATRIGVRAVDVRDALTLHHLGRYQEPRLVTGIAASGDRIVINGPHGGTFLRDELALLVPEAPVEMAPHAVAMEMLEDGRWALLASDGKLYLEGTGPLLTISTESWSQGLAVEGNLLAVSVGEGAYVMNVETQALAEMYSGKAAALPPAIAISGGEIFVASPEWTAAQNASQKASLAPHGVFGDGDALNVSLWRAGLPRRLLLPSDYGLIELASLGPRAGLVLHGDPAISISMPSGNYLAGAVAGGRAYLVTTDRGSYRSQLVTVSLPALAIVDIRSFTGQAADIAIGGDRLYLADADRGVRVYDIAGGKPLPLGTVQLGEEVSP
jgi:hypothetical protein